MAIDPHLRFAGMPAAFLRSFGAELSLTTAGGAIAVTGIVRSSTDIMNDATGGAGQMGDEAFLAVSQSSASLLSEGDTFTHSGRTWRIAGPGARDGRAMVIFPIEVAP